MDDGHRRDPRVPIELRIKLAYESVDDFVECHALNISRGGIFIQTTDLKPPDTVVSLLIEIGTGEKVIRGKGVVRWITPPSPTDQPASRPPGMGVKFLELDSESRALVDLVVATEGKKDGADEPPSPDDEKAQEPAEEIGDIELEDSDISEEKEPAPAAAAEGNTALPPEAPPLVASAPAHDEVAAKVPVVKSSGKHARVIGIDLGTTNSCAAVADGGKAHVLTSRQGYTTIPSIIAYDQHGKLLIGHPAKAQMIINPRNTVYGAKRLVGRPFASPTVQACRDRFHYEIVEGPAGEAAVRFAGQEFSLQQVSAFLLQELRDMACQVLGDDVTRAVVTVPAHYNDHQRQAVREAGLLAGLDIERIVNEPTAAALAFGYGRGLEKRVLIYDLGGGTFDASILDIQGDIYEVVSTGGDTFLGGVDFDNQLVDHLAYKFMEKHGFAPPEDRVVWQRLRDSAEMTKIALSERDKVVAHVPYFCKGKDGKDVELNIEVTRAELEGMTAQLVDRTIDVCREVLSIKGLEAKDIGEVLLVGGQSRMPLVWRKIHEAFGREPNKSVHPDEAVALGAALLADSSTRIDSIVLIDVLAVGIGIGLPGGRMAQVLPRNTKLPAKKSHEIATTHDRQTELDLAVFQGDSQKVSECEYLGTVRVTNLPAVPRGAIRVNVEFSLGQEGILSIAAKNLTTGQVSEFKFATLDTPESLREKLQIPEPQIPPKGSRPLEHASSHPESGHKGFLGRIFRKH